MADAVGHRGSNPFLAGALTAVLAAVSFGVSTPFIQRFGVGLGPFTTALLLYAGAALGTLRLPWHRTAKAEPGIQRKHVLRLTAVAVFGAAVAPSLLAWGLQHVPATYGSLLLNIEAVFTVALAALVFREHVGRRAVAALVLMLAGGAVAVAGSSAVVAGGLLGALAIVGAVLFWALDNTLTRPLSDLDPAAVVRGKALIGMLLTLGLALAHREATPRAAQVVGLLVCGASGYGLSLRFYLLAQRQVGAARTGSVFAAAPFLGAGMAWLLGDQGASGATVVAGILFAAGIALHLTERHDHEHSHATLEHEHAHRHDDGHHKHQHETYPKGSHSHLHRHEPLFHGHPHGPDVHHAHGH